MKVDIYRPAFLITPGIVTLPTFAYLLVPHGADPLNQSISGLNKPIVLLQRGVDYPFDQRHINNLVNQGYSIIHHPKRV